MNSPMGQDEHQRIVLEDPGWLIIRAIKTRPQRFKVFGERASGTNFAQYLLQRNTSISHVQRMKYGWKHGFPGFLAVARSDLIVVIFRDPFDWVRSFFAKPWCSDESMHVLGFSEFIRAEWKATLQRPRRWFELSPPFEYNGLPLQMDRDPISGLPFRNILEMRNAKSAAWLGLANREINVVFARHDAVSASPDRFLGELAKIFEIEVNNDIVLPAQRLGSGFDLVDVAARRSEAQQISKQDRAFIRSQLDLSQERRLGYLLD